MHKRLFIAVSSAAALLAVAFGVIGVRSYWKHDVVLRASGGRLLAAESREGRLSVVVVERWPYDEGLTWGHIPVSGTLNSPLISSASVNRPLTLLKSRPQKHWARFGLAGEAGDAIPARRSIDGARPGEPSSVPYVARAVTMPAWRPPFTKFGYNYNRRDPTVLYVAYRQVHVPHWMICGALAILPTLTLVRSVRRRVTSRYRAQRGLCPRCGYDLRASPDKCPECGLRAPAGDREALGVAAQ